LPQHCIFADRSKQTLDTNSSMTLHDVLSQLESLGDEKVRRQNHRNGAGDNQYGVKLGDIRKLAAKIKTDHALALELWETGNLDARLLAILVMKPADLSVDELDRMVRSVASPQEADWLSSYVIRKHPGKETLRMRWMTDDDPWATRAGWDLTAERIGRSPEGLDLAALLDRIEAEMGTAPRGPQWTMNNCLAGIGIHFPEHRERALAIGESLGVYRDYPVSKGCTSPFAPIWINEMVRRQG
jgi:3-methyladenine DNA glycosylase AlkD